jgi:hypothetical protein
MRTYSSVMVAPALVAALATVAHARPATTTTPHQAQAASQHAAGVSETPCDQLSTPDALQAGLSSSCTAGRFAPPIRSTAQRYPVMGCNADGYAPESPFEVYAPAKCLIASGAGLESWADIQHVRWSHWGRRSVTGKGYFGALGCAGGCGPSVPASMVVYGRVADRAVHGTAYTWLRVTPKRSVTHKRTWKYYVRPKRSQINSASARNRQHRDRQQS